MHRSLEQVPRFNAEVYKDRHDSDFSSLRNYTEEYSVI